MKNKPRNEIEIQRNYYAKTAHLYNEMHVNEQDPHSFALSFMVAALEYFNINSILDIGSGTGRTIAYIKEKQPEVTIIGIEPVQELREAGYSQGIPRDSLIEGDATQLKFSDRSFDLVCEFGVLHHVRNPERVISEMLRVADKAIFISDSNNFGQGSWPARIVKQALNAVRLWKIIDLIKTGGKGYTISEGDGLAYSYSIFTNYRLIKEHCNRIHMLNTGSGNNNFYRSASTIALMGIKNKLAPSALI